MRAPSNMLILFVAGVWFQVATVYAVAGEDAAKTQDVLEAIADQPVPAKPQVMYFEYTLADRIVGYALHRLAPAGTKGEEGYDYYVETMLHMPRSARIALRIEAKLTRAFEPTEIQSYRDVISPDGTKQRTREGLFVDGDIVTTEEQDNDGAVYADTVPLPDRPFVFATEFIVQRIDLKAFPAFVLREIDPKRGGVLVQTFKATPDEHGGLKLVSTTQTGVTDYQFLFDDKHRLVSFQEAPLPLVARRCTRERREELRHQLWKK